MVEGGNSGNPLELELVLTRNHIRDKVIRRVRKIFKPTADRALITFDFEPIADSRLASFFFSIKAIHLKPTERLILYFSDARATNISTKGRLELNGEPKSGDLLFNSHSRFRHDRSAIEKSFLEFTQNDRSFIVTYSFALIIIAVMLLVISLLNSSYYVYFCSFKKK